MSEMDVRFYAGKPLKVAGEMRAIGDEIPEAIHWSMNAVHSMHRQGSLIIKNKEGNVEGFNIAWARMRAAQRERLAEKKGNLEPKNDEEKDCAATTKAGNPCNRKGTEKYGDSFYCHQHHKKVTDAG